MKTSSPLRYPGGKSTMSGLLSGIRRLNGLGDRAVAEPFAGGAGASLSLLYQEETSDIYINDADPAIHDFWWTLVNRPKPFIDLFKRKRVSVREWRRQREIYRDRRRVSRLRRGFSTFYLNRCNRSGIIINGGPIGGLDQSGKWKINARFNKDDLRRRCEKVSEYGSRIHVSCLDAIDFIRRHDPSTLFFFIDPPYFVKGEMLYLDSLDESYHASLAIQLKSMSHTAWVLTYDDCPEVHAMYKGWATIRQFSLKYSAAERRSGKEVLIVPQWMRLPSFQSSAAIAW